MSKLISTVIVSVFLLYSAPVPSIMASATPSAAVRGKSTSGPKKRGVRGVRRHAKRPKVANRVTEVAPIVALDQGSSKEVPFTFQAFHKMSAMEREVLTPLTETELDHIP
jgi:hypothetical protein